MQQVDRYNFKVLRGFAQDAARTTRTPTGPLPRSAPPVRQSPLPTHL
jgi:hypothetical protein